MLYLLEVMLYSAILYGVYLLVLRNRATHAWNRLYLVLCATLPALLPFVQIPGVSIQYPLLTGIQSVTLPEITVSSVTGKQVVSDGLSADVLFTAAFLLVAAILLARLAVQYIAIRRFITGRENKEYPGNVRVITGCGYGPGSFGKYVFFPTDEISDDILQHEIAHINRRHSYDILLIKLLQCIFWPNVMLAVILKELRVIHEFEADVNAPTDKETYIRALLDNIFQTKRFSLSHTFFHHPIKRRIIMLQKTPQSRGTMRATIIKSGLFASLLVAGVIYLQSCSHPVTDKQMLEQIAANEPAPPNGPQTKDGKTYEYVEQMPESSVDIPTFLGQNIKYPEVSKKNNVEGRVVVRFIVDEEGNVKSPVVMRSPDDATAAEAVRVIQLMPKWKPGKDKGKNVAVYFTLPISFKL